MSTGVPESDSYAESGDRGWDVQPAVPGWSMGQDFYTGPIYDDTSWHIDLSGVDWAGRGSQRDNERASSDFRFGSASYQDGPGRSGDGGAYDSGSAAAADRTQHSGRHARHARSDDQTRPVRGPRPPGMRRKVAGSPGGRATSVPERYREPDAYEQPGNYQEPAGWRQAGHQQPQYWPEAPPEAGPYGTDTYSTQAYETHVFETQAFHTDELQAPRRQDWPQVPGQRRPGQRPGEADGYAPDGMAALAGATAPARARPRDGGEPVSVVRSSGVMAAGTLGSRVTGFVRLLVQNYAIGFVGIGYAYNLSNTLPNVVYNLALGGILTSVIVPLIVAAGRRASDRGEGYEQRMFTLVTVALFGITVIATLAAAPIVHLYSGSAMNPSTEHLAVIFALFFIPQIFFYGMSSLIGAILNARGSFASPMWTPIVNNVVVMVVFGLYVAIGGVGKVPGTVSDSEVGLLGFGTTLGIVVQTVAMLPALRRVGFRWRPDTRFRRAEVAEIGRIGGWMFGYVAATTVAFWVTTKVAGDTGAGVSEYNYAWLLFQLPYAVVGISVITALLPRMSAHASERRFSLVRQDFSMGVRLASAIVVPCSLVLAVLGPRLGVLFFGYGRHTTIADARYTGVVFAVFCLGLLPYMIFQLQLRVFYSMHDSRTPALIGLVTMTVNIMANLIALAVLPKSALIAGLGVGFGLSNVAGLAISWRILARRLRGLDGHVILRSLVRMHAATLPAALAPILIGLMTGSVVIDVIIGGGLALALYLLFARVLKLEELSSLTRSGMARLGR